MGAGGASVHGSNAIFDRKLDSCGKPNSRSDRYRNGIKVQSRWYDLNGKAVRNRDYKHGGNVKFPQIRRYTAIFHPNQPESHLNRRMVFSPKKTITICYFLQKN